MNIHVRAKHSLYITKEVSTKLDFINNQSSNEFRYRYMFDNSDTNYSIVDNDTHLLIYDTILDLSKMIEETSINSNIEAKLKDLGTLIYTLLIPDSLKPLLKRTKNDYLIIETEEQDIPWELIYNGKTFLCDLFIIGRSLPRNVQQVSTQINKKIVVKLVGPDERLKGAMSELNAVEYAINNSIKRIKAVYNIDVEVTKMIGTDATKKKVLLDSVLQKEIITIFHFAGHTEVDLSRLESSGLVLFDGNLKNYEVEKLPPFSIVFINACWTGLSGVNKMASSYGVVKGIAQSFIKAGARAVVATLFPIEDNAASRFACMFYEKAIEGYSIGDAIKLARRKIKTAKNGINYLSYLLFGDPQKRLPIYEPEVTSGPFINESGFEEVFRLEKEFSRIELLLVNDLPWILWSIEEFTQWVERIQVSKEIKKNILKLLRKYQNHFKNLIYNGKKDLISIVNSNTLKQYLNRCENGRINSLISEIEKLTETKHFMLLIYNSVEQEIEELELVSKNANPFIDISDTVYVYNKQTRFESNPLAYYLYIDYNQKMITEYIQKFENYLKDTLKQYNLISSLKPYDVIQQNRKTIMKLTNSKIKKLSTSKHH